MRSCYRICYRTPWDKGGKKRMQNAPTPRKCQSIGVFQQALGRNGMAAVELETVLLSRLHQAKDRAERAVVNFGAPW